MNRFAVLVFGTVLLACNSRLDSNSGAIDSCDGLRDDIQSAIADQCASTAESGTASGASGYCSTCVGAGLYDYTTSRAGVCTCTPLTFVAGACAGTVTDSAVAALITAADNQCVSFVLPTALPAADAAAGGAATPAADGGAEAAADAGTDSGASTVDAAVDAADGAAD